MQIRTFQTLYNIIVYTVTALGLPFAVPLFLFSEKRRKTFLHRLGFGSLPDSFLKHRQHSPNLKPVWVHALSVGEVLSAVPLVNVLKKNVDNNRPIVFSASTYTGFSIAQKQLSNVADAIVYFPYDLTLSVKKRIDAIDPALVIIVETDIWPNFLFEMHRRRLPVLLVNARLSDRSFRGYKRVAFMTKPLFATFEKICAQSAADAARFAHLNVPADRISVTGNLKFDQASSDLPDQSVESYRQSMAIPPGRKILLAGSTHKHEEAILMDAFVKLHKEFPDLLFIVAPRNPKRADSVCRLFTQAGFSAVLMKSLNTPVHSEQPDVIVVDAMGILRNLYALADIAYVGGSLVNQGGHNPLEPAAFSKPILFGPDMRDFAEISRLLVASGGAAQVQDAAGLYNIGAKLLTDNDMAGEMGKRAFEVFSANKGSVEKTLQIIRPYFKNV